MKFKTRIWLLPASAAVVFMIGQVANLVVSNRASQAIDVLSSVDAPYLRAVTQIDRQVEAFRLTLQSAAAEGDAASLSDVHSVVKATRETFEQTATIGSKRAMVKTLEAAFDAYQQPAIQATEALLSKSDGGDAMTRMQSAQQQLGAMLKSEIAAANAAVLAQQQTVTRGISTSFWVSVGTGVIVLLVLGWASWLIVRSVWRDLGEEPDTLRRAAQSVADGQLMVNLAVQPGDDARSLAAAMGRMVENLRETVGTIRSASDSIATAASEISSGNQDLSQRTEQAASNLQETASSMEQLTCTVQQNAASAQAADTVAKSATAAATRGGELVEQVVQSMQGIDDASHKIHEIIGVIDSIAFQTNILALNAAVEAARAGDHGRGFAVVATEVRNLAQRSASAAHEIKALISTSSERVEQGSQRVRDAGAAMGEILRGVQQVASTLSEIAISAHEQSTGIGLVNEAITKLDHMTQQNAALVEQSAAAAGSLREQAVTMAQTVARFRTEEAQCS